jgi:hypothetical protein
MKTISAKLFLEQVQAGAEVHPHIATMAVVQVGRLQYECDLRALNDKQAAELEGLYWSGRIRFAYPGDFTVPPCCFRRQKLRCRIIDAAQLTTVPPHYPPRHD